MRKSTSKLSKSDWLDEALQVLAKSGFEAVAVESLARRLEVTKGSFYWHFKSRSELIKLLLAFWEGIEEQYIDEYKQSYGGARVFLKEILKVLISDQTNKRVFLQLSHHLSDEAIKSAYDRAVKRRLNLFSEAYVKMGMEKMQAKEKALMTYCGYFGLIKLTDDGLEDVLTQEVEARLIGREIEFALTI
ncbi:TetR/AcrR family transcriptional regulator [Bermanella sp. WJH001]|uniref:TetR/AcrR family transcriptional regulator n=1 Tax=Bermanella sp. WJH001 TaxID=3048005 RepID=UPI0024BEEB0B|nr:TetR/AcrR family transcriptional regulator [Bermanella sp. WJH001]MDJ1538294.1 TetR/AcrR family transcriptional regulator [Bermanella sp. WJH001]